MIKQLSWSEFGVAVDQIHRQLLAKSFVNVYGIPKGGLTLAVCLANRLEIPLILSLDEVSQCTLICDDIVDTGHTVQKLGLMHNYVVTVHYKKNLIFKPNIWVYEKTDEWIKYPWE